MRKWHRYTQEFKDQAVARLKGCTNIEALARELHVSRGILYLWRDKQEGTPPASKRVGPVADTPAIASLKKEVIQLKVALADKALEADFVEFRAVGVRNVAERALLWFLRPQRCSLCGRHSFLFRWQVPAGETA